MKIAKVHWRVLSRIWEFETISASSVSSANSEIAVNAEDIKDVEIVSISQILDMYGTGPTTDKERKIERCQRAILVFPGYLPSPY